MSLSYSHSASKFTPSYPGHLKVSKLKNPNLGKQQFPSAIEAHHDMPKTHEPSSEWLRRTENDYLKYTGSFNPLSSFELGSFPNYSHGTSSQFPFTLPNYGAGLSFEQERAPDSDSTHNEVKRSQVPPSHGISLDFMPKEHEYKSPDHQMTQDYYRDYTSSIPARQEVGSNSLYEHHKGNQEDNHRLHRDHQDSQRDLHKTPPSEATKPHVAVEETQEHHFERPIASSTMAAHLEESRPALEDHVSLLRSDGSFRRNHLLTRSDYETINTALMLSNIEPLSYVSTQNIGHKVSQKKAKMRKLDEIIRFAVNRPEKQEGETIDYMKQSSFTMNRSLALKNQNNESTMKFSKINESIIDRGEIQLKSLQARYTPASATNIVRRVNSLAKDYRKNIIISPRDPQEREPSQKVSAGSDSFKASNSSGQRGVVNEQERVQGPKRTARGVGIFESDPGEMRPELKAIAAKFTADVIGDLRLRNKQDIEGKAVAASRSMKDFKKSILSSNESKTPHSQYGSIFNFKNLRSTGDLPSGIGAGAAVSPIPSNHFIFQLKKGFKLKREAIFHQGN